MGLGVRDLNHDQRPDLRSPERTACPCWRARSTESGPRRTGCAGTGRSASATSASAGAWRWVIDNDGRTDMVTGRYFLQCQYSGDQHDAVHLQEEDGRFIDVADAWGLDDPGWTRVLLVDLNDDGWLDLVRRRLHERRGDLPVAALRRPWSSNWLAAAPTRMASVHGWRWTRRKAPRSGDPGGWSRTGERGPPRAHFGLGDHERVDAIRVHWRDGFVSDPRNVPANGRVTFSAARSACTPRSRGRSAPSRRGKDAVVGTVAPPWGQGPAPGDVMRQPTRLQQVGLTSGGDPGSHRGGGHCPIQSDGAFPHANFYVPDEELGVRLEPGATMRFQLGDNPVSEIRVNADGYRGDDWPLPGKDEILVVGDSQVFGLGVEGDETFSARLAEATGRTVLNGGVPTYGPAEYAAVALEVARSRPVCR